MPKQVYIAGLWWWGSTLSRSSEAGTEFSSLVLAKPVVLTTASVIIAVFMWIVGAILFLGLPDYYRQAPGKVPSFLISLFRRKIVLWFFMTVVSSHFGVHGKNPAHTRPAHSEFLPLGALWSQLAIPLVFETCSCLPNRSTRCPVLHLGLGRPVICVQCSQQEPYLDPAFVCHRSGSSSLVSNALGYIRHWTIRTLGRKSGRFRDCGTIALALARSARFTTRSWVRHDSPPHAHPISHHLYPYHGAGPWVHRDDCSERVWTKQDRARPSLS
jgi:hypothetical protein